MSLKPICIPCKRFFRCTKNGKAFTEGMPVENGALPGLAQPELWKAYKCWRGDMWSCPDCGAEIIVGTGFNNYAEHYQENFAEVQKATGADQLQINDC